MFIDLHCHPSIKPFGQAFPENKNRKDPSCRESIWHSEPPTRRDKKCNTVLGVTRFTQSSFTDLYKGDFRVIVAALNPVEKGFLTSYRLTSFIPDLFYNFITGIGIKKINFIQHNKNDFSELRQEYKFYKKLHNRKVKIFHKKVRYRLTKRIQDIHDNLNSGKNIISVVLSIEGAYTFIHDNTREFPDPLSVLSKIDAVKQWKYPPFFVTFSHHFYNKMGGHARSLPKGIVRLLINQKKGMNDDLYPLGKDVIRRLLDTSNGKRIYIDVKHMSQKVRLSYYKMLDNEYANEDIPVIVSHGAVNGRSEMRPDDPSPGEENGEFNGRDINLYDSEIIRIEDSDGIFGLQIDERQITNKREKKNIRHTSCDEHHKLFMWTRLVWNQIQYIADLLDYNERPAWDIVCLGTDFDGIVDPIDGYWTAEDIPYLRCNLEPMVTDYLNNKRDHWKLSTNDIPPEEVLDRIFNKNALEFLKKYYK